MKTAKTAIHKLRSLLQGTSNSGIAALLLLGTSAFVAHEIQKEISTREDSAIQAGACFKVEEIQRFDFAKLTGAERLAWSPFACKFRELMDPCSESDDVYYKKCGFSLIKKCVAGDAFGNCVDYQIACPSDTRVMRCFEEKPQEGKRWHYENPPNGKPVIDDCIPVHKIAVPYGTCNKQ